MCRLGRLLVAWWRKGEGAVDGARGTCTGPQHRPSTRAPCMHPRSPLAVIVPAQTAFLTEITSRSPKLIEVATQQQRDPCVTNYLKVTTPSTGAFPDKVG